jgi:phosphosulfolactate synthase (CoM biosynthesis protein A)
MSASQELEKNAANYASEAVRLDKQGSRGMAITLYQKSIESLLQLVQLYPEYGLNKVYVQKAIAYQERIKAIQGTVDVPREQPHAEVRNSGREGETKKSEGSKSNYEELIVTEKLNVKWEEVVEWPPQRRR